MTSICLPGTERRIQPLGLGTANYGTTVPAEDAFAQMDAFAAAGGTLIDTARVYGDWAPGPAGMSEKTIGRWLRDRGMRQQMILVTKGAHPPLNDMTASRVTPAAIEQDLTESLSHLETGWIDIYLLHRDDPQVPVGEILDCLEEKRREGRIRCYGCSNWTAARMREAQAYAARRGLDGFRFNQMQYSLPAVNEAAMSRSDMRALDTGCRAFHQETGLPLLAYMAIGGGCLHKLFLGRPLTGGTHEFYENETNRRLAGCLRDTCASEAEITRCLLYFLWEEPAFPVIPLVSFSKREQLDDCLSCLEGEAPPPALLARLRAIREDTVRC